MILYENILLRGMAITVLVQRFKVPNHDEYVIKSRNEMTD